MYKHKLFGCYNAFIEWLNINHIEPSDIVLTNLYDNKTKLLVVYFDRKEEIKEAR